MTADVADMKVSDPAPSKPPPDVSTSMAAKHEEDYPHEEETAEERAKREAELQKIYADLAKEDDRCPFCTLIQQHCLHPANSVINALHHTIAMIRESMLLACGKVIIHLLLHHVYMHLAVPRYLQ